MTNKDEHTSSGVLAVRLPLADIAEVKDRAGRRKLSVNQWLVNTIQAKLRRINMNMALVAKDSSGKPITRQDGRYLTSSINCSAGEVIGNRGKFFCLNCGQTGDKAYEIQHLKPARHGKGG